MFRATVRVAWDTTPGGAASKIRTASLKAGLDADAANDLARRVEVVVADFLSKARDIRAIGGTFEAERSVETPECRVTIETALGRRGLVARLLGLLGRRR